ncbi:MAG: MerR family transcriptional regulator [Pseudomonadota bacterium]
MMLDTNFANPQLNVHQSLSGNTGYKIGAVSRITGIGSETIRAWERRYQAVVPTRTESGDRMFSRNDVKKLILLKSLVDNGNSIGTIARLDFDELKHFAEDYPNNQRNTSELSNDVDCKVVLLGDGFPIRILDGLEEINGIKVTGIYESLNDFNLNTNDRSQTNIVVIEKPTINEDIHKEISQILETSEAWHVIVIYGFANQEQIEQLQSSQVTVVRSAVDVQELARMCIYHSGGSEQLPSLEKNSTLHYEQTIPSRKFSNKQLSKLAGASSTIKCECPMHLSNIVRDLVAFEIYSAECESENKQDAALHNYLHATTAQARSMLEEAMAHLIRVEGIDIN